MTTQPGDRDSCAPDGITTKSAIQSQSIRIAILRTAEDLLRSAFSWSASFLFGIDIRLLPAADVARGRQELLSRNAGGWQRLHSRRRMSGREGCQEAGFAGRRLCTRLHSGSKLRKVFHRKQFPGEEDESREYARCSPHRLKCRGLTLLRGERWRAIPRF